VVINRKGGILILNFDLRNKYKVEGDTVIIYIVKRNGESFEAFFGLEDIDKVKEANLKWHIKTADTNGLHYVQACKYLGIIDGKPKYQTLYLHQIILGVSGRKKMVDHINHNPLDNRQSNLRLRTNKENVTHRKGANKNSTTGIRNVCYDRTHDKYIVQLQVDGKHKCFGRFDNLDEAVECAERVRDIYYT
jgi:hypothetical protein